MKQLYAKTNVILEWLLVGLFAILVVDVLIQVGSRFLLGQSYSFTEELARFALIWLSVLGAAYMTGKNEHLYMDFVFDKLSMPKKLVFARTTQVFIALFSLVVLVIGGANLTYITLHLGQISPALGIPLGYVYMVVPFSGAIILFYAAYNFINVKDLVHAPIENQ